MICGVAIADMAENIAPGWEEGVCTEIDLLEANNHAMQTAIHMQTGGEYGSGNCDANGCFARIGGPMAPPELMNAYGEGKKIDTRHPFDVHTSVDTSGAISIILKQDGRLVTSFDHKMAGAHSGSCLP